jgi:hypothetical protein
MGAKEEDDKPDPATSIKDNEEASINDYYDSEADDADDHQQPLYSRFAENNLHQTEMIAEEREAMAKMPEYYTPEETRKITAKLTLALCHELTARILTDSGNAARHRRGKF